MTSNPVADPTTRLLPFAATAVTAFAASASADKGWIIIWKENDAIDRAYKIDKNEEWRCYELMKMTCSLFTSVNDITKL